MSRDSNLSAVLHKVDDIRLENTPIPEPGRGEVLLEMNKVGICGSDVHYWVNGRIGDFIVKEAMILGHESSGTVVALGDDVKNLNVGDRVAIEPGVPCRICDFCKTGRYNMCREMAFCATPPVHGTLRRFYCHAADFCFKLPDHVSFEEGALLEPLSVGVHACRRAGVTIGKRVLICGAGPIGLVSLLTTRAMGAASIGITDLVKGRLDTAKKLGANYVFSIDVSKTPKEQAVAIAEAMGDAPDIVIECSGAEKSVQMGIYAAKSGGMLVLVGLGPAEITIPIVDAAVREVDIRGIFRYANCYPTALSMVASGQVDVKPLITHWFTLEETVKAFETAKTGAGGAIKVMISCKDHRVT